MTIQTQDRIVTIDGVALRRREAQGPRGGKRYIYQAVGASETWGYWYDSASQAASESNASDRIGTGAPL